ncbi:adenylate isopentenyltransferase 8, chloroplastic-like [Phragmites australis]|uniref:adenylate isopentenyltransferase 8, chloroplastic-like n=1 Tax=Phragmites australis TaxID=29695 RepID=UPI002D7999CF|nr:adenylate isopentenyltransferase 8, chloroplastic-like [Phragmites australis]
MLATKSVVIMGATGMGKMKISIDASRVIDGKVVNADKMQIYYGLDITTNKVCPIDQSGIPHHVIGTISSTTGDFPVSFFRSIATTTAKSIVRHGRIPVLVGGSNSLMHGFLMDHLDPSLVNPFAIAGYLPTFRFRSCLLWIHASESIFNEYLNRRVDNMLVAGLVEELKDYFDTVFGGKLVKHLG